MAESTLLGRSAGTAYSRLVQDVFGLTTRLANEREKLKADRNLSDEGRRSREAALAKALVKDHVHITRPLRLAAADISAKRAALQPKPVDRTDVVTELQRRELREFVRSMPLEKRFATVFGLTDDEQESITSAPSILSGLPQDQYNKIVEARLEKQFGSQIKALESAGEELSAVEAAATMTRQDLLKASGLSEHEFLALENSFEH